MNNKLLKTILLTLVLSLTSAASAQTTRTVTNTNDAGAGSLRQTIIDAAAGDTIVFDATVFGTPQTINLTTGTNSIGATSRLVINKSLTITGPGARLLTLRDAGTSSFSRVLAATAGTVRISGMTFTNGRFAMYGSAVTSGNSIVSLTLDGIAASGNGTNGCEGVIVATAGTLTILNSTISNNPCIAVFNEINPTEINIANTTISGNNDTSNGLGAIYRNGAGTYNLNNVTVTNNTPDGFNNSSTATGAINVRNSIIAGNRTASGTPKDITGAFVSQGNNLIGNTTGGTGFTQPTDKTNVAANLGALANNGGQTDTHLPQL